MIVLNLSAAETFSNLDTETDTKLFRLFLQCSACHLFYNIVAAPANYILYETFFVSNSYVMSHCLSDLLIME